MRTAGILLLMSMTAGAQVYGADQPVTIRLAWNEAPPAAIAATLHARNATGTTKPLDIAVHDREAFISLSAGQWFVSASSPGYWSEPVLVAVGNQRTEANLTLYRSARLSGLVKIPAGEARALDVYFNPTEQTSQLPRSSTACSIANGHFDCELPAGLYDLAFRIPGHASLYRWDVDLREKASVDLGQLTFRRGATLSGRVELDGQADQGERNDPFEGVQVSLRNAMGSERNDEMRSRQSMTRTVTRPNKRGFFSFDVLPGSYVVSASSSGLVSEERPVRVMEGGESVLEKPLTLERLWTLTVNVQLPPEGANMPWKLAVTRFDSEGGASAERVVSVPAEGICRFENQIAGSYSIELRIHDSVWAAESSILDRDKTVDMPVRVTKVHGSIRLGENPLQARLLFLSPEKGFRIPVRSHADGTFLLYLPSVTGELWDEVEIQSKQPWVKRLLEKVPLKSDGEGGATVDLRLPEIRIDGIVVDESGHPVSQGMINIAAPDGFQQLEMSDGTFEIHGLQPGRYALTAATPERETDAPLYVDVSNEGDAKHDVILKVAPISQFQGSVASISGPVIGASVFIDAASSTHPVIGTIPVDPAGAFDFRLPPQTREMLVAVTAPGFSFRMMRMPAPEAKLDILVDQNGGVLRIDGGVAARAEPFRPYLIHNGAILSGFAVAYLARGQFLANPEQRVHFEISLAEEGTYSLCLLSNDEERSVSLGARPPESRCTSGVLARHGALDLRGPDVNQNHLVR